jgi:hypothetical protein
MLSGSAPTMANDVTKLITTLRASGVLDDPSLRKGIAKYSALQRNLQTTPDVTQAPDFQRQFRSFYRVRRGVAWQWVFFEFMQQHRRSAPDFRRSLLALADQTHRCEASFASKLAATLNPDLPVLDALVLAVMRAHLPGEWTLLRTGTLDSRLGRAVEVYGRLTDAVRRIIATDAGAELLKLFDRQYAQHAFTNTKKLDFMLWRYGATM